MKFELAVAIECKNEVPKGKKEVVVFIGIEAGIYIAKFTQPDAVFVESTNVISALNTLSKDFSVQTTMEFEFKEEDLKQKDGFKGVRCYKCATVRIKYENDWITLLVEYLDGNIPQHGHRPGESEIYASADKPYIGKVCRCGERHKSFAEHTIAVKQLV